MVAAILCSLVMHWCKYLVSSEYFSIAHYTDVVSDIEFKMPD